MDLQSGELRKGGSPVALETRAFQVLGLLLRHSGDVVAVQDFQRQFRGVAPLTQEEVGESIARVRTALADSESTPLYVATVEGRGYRFIAPVDLIARPPVTRSPEPVRVENKKAIVSAPTDTARSSGRKVVLVLGAVVIFCVTILLLLFLRTPLRYR